MGYENRNFVHDRSRDNCGIRVVPKPSTVNAVPPLLLDLDGTLIDSVYEHVMAWREALEEVEIRLPHWKIHRRIGMSGRLFLPALLRELGQRTVAVPLDAAGTTS